MVHRIPIFADLVRTRQAGPCPLFNMSAMKLLRRVRSRRSAGLTFAVPCVGSTAQVQTCAIACSMERTGDLWDTGAVDITGSLMVLVLKQVALGYNLSDSFSSKRGIEFGVERQYFKMGSPPNILHYFSYIFATGNLLAGPFFEYRDYVDFISRRGKFVEACKREYLGAAAKAAMQCFGVAIASIVVSQVISAKFPPLLLVPPHVQKVAMWQRYAIAFLIGAPASPLHPCRAFAPADASSAVVLQAMCTATEMLVGFVLARGRLHLCARHSHRAHCKSAKL